MSGTIRLGLNIPLFTASLISIGLGTFTGMIGIWGYAAQKLAIPEWIKVGHAHDSWWAVLIMIAAVTLPSLPLARWFRNFVIAASFISPGLWLLSFYSYYAHGIESAKYLMPVFEILLFLSLLGVALVASGVNIPIITTRDKPATGRYDIVSNIEISRRIFLIPTIVAVIGVLAGFGLAGLFKAYHKPISPAALVQLHDHLVLISVSAVISLLVLRVVNASEKVFNLATRLMEISLPLTALGLILFNFLGLSSLVWVVPAGIYFMIPIITFLTLIGVLPRSPSYNTYISALRASLAVVYAMILILVAQGAYISMIWDTNPYVTVTFKQPQGQPYPGPYPTEFLGTAPVKGTPRGLENAHLSPGSWSHVAAMWLTILGLVGPNIFVERLRRPGLLYLFLITIPLAPLFNMIGRYLAWWPGLPEGAPGGIGALWYAGHPLKGFNIISLFVISLVLLYLAPQKKIVEKSVSITK